MNRIEKALDRNGVKQKWLSKEIGKSYNMVNSYVRNIRQPSIDVLYQNAIILDVEVKELLVDNKKLTD